MVEIGFASVFAIFHAKWVHAIIIHDSYGNASFLEVLRAIEPALFDGKIILVVVAGYVR